MARNRDETLDRVRDALDDAESSVRHAANYLDDLEHAAETPLGNGHPHTFRLVSLNPTSLDELLWRAARSDNLDDDHKEALIQDLAAAVEELRKARAA